MPTPAERPGMYAGNTPLPSAAQSNSPSGVHSGPSHAADRYVRESYALEPSHISSETDLATSVAVDCWLSDVRQQYSEPPEGSPHKQPTRPPRPPRPPPPRSSLGGKVWFPTENQKLQAEQLSEKLYKQLQDRRKIEELEVLRLVPTTAFYASRIPSVEEVSVFGYDGPLRIANPDIPSPVEKIPGIGYKVKEPPECEKPDACKPDAELVDGVSVSSRPTLGLVPQDVLPFPSSAGQVPTPQSSVRSTSPQGTAGNASVSSTPAVAPNLLQGPNSSQRSTLRTSKPSGHLAVPQIRRRPVPLRPTTHAQQPSRIPVPKRNRHTSPQLPPGTEVAANRSSTRASPPTVHRQQRERPRTTPPRPSYANKAYVPYNPTYGQVTRTSPVSSGKSQTHSPTTRASPKRHSHPRQPSTSEEFGEIFSAPRVTPPHRKLTTLFPPTPSIPKPASIRSNAYTAKRTQPLASRSSLPLPILSPGLPASGTQSRGGNRRPPTPTAIPLHRDRHAQTQNHLTTVHLTPSAARAAANWVLLNDGLIDRTANVARFRRKRYRCRVQVEVGVEQEGGEEEEEVWVSREWEWRELGGEEGAGYGEA
ncbi:hypothetical protein M011DRAFT_475922 [Sporormia fimetaria CBS 119925]|uniref:Uncharacterized protein n=1 Tax=Sporormia fimetaria CBS 119925 TaxID=1340428 RepID=A0A6A6VI31_9PLEO|nr:hypothetical protein M011DRAFT_475922 [Sporormia fimetaria CBS 119925]